MIVNVEHSADIAGRCIHLSWSVDRLFDRPDDDDDKTSMTDDDEMLSVLRDLLWKKWKRVACCDRLDTVAITGEPQCRALTK